jgi:hypothetical protein
MSIMYKLRIKRKASFNSKGKNLKKQLARSLFTTNSASIIKNEKNNLNL